MSKLIYRTKQPKKGYVFNESFMTHESSGFRNRLPQVEEQQKAMELVKKSLEKLVESLDELGYDPTKVRFQIHYKS